MVPFQNSFCLFICMRFKWTMQVSCYVAIVDFTSNPTGKCKLKPNQSSMKTTMQLHLMFKSLKIDKLTNAIQRSEKTVQGTCRPNNKIFFFIGLKPPAKSSKYYFISIPRSRFIRPFWPNGCSYRFERYGRSPQVYHQESINNIIVVI